MLPGTPPLSSCTMFPSCSSGEPSGSSSTRLVNYTFISLNPLQIVTGCPISLKEETTAMSQEETPQELTRLTKEVRRIWHKGEWFYSVVDIIAVLTDSTNPNTYWRVL